MTYPEALAYISSLRALGWRLGLDRMQAFCEEAGLDSVLGGQDGPNYIHVAGTNGKGSTTAYLQSILTTAGLQTGAYFSPYVVDPRERIQLGKQYIDPVSFAEIATELLPIAEGFRETTFGGISEFEFKTGIGFRYWQRERCEWIALEVGLGGRLDATNVVTPRAGIIVSVGWDHMNILGGTISAIATEKAGIIKPGVPVVAGKLPPDAMRVVKVQSDELNAPLWTFGQEVRWEKGVVSTPGRTIHRVEPALVGTMQGHNLSLAIAALEAAGLSLDEEIIREGARTARLPGRFERRTIHGKQVILDGAHNIDSARVLRDSLKAYAPGSEFALVTNMLQGHDNRAFYRTLSKLVRETHVVPIGFHRALSVDETVASLQRLEMSVQGHRDLREGLQSALDSPYPVLVTGSFYLVGEALQLLDELVGQEASAAPLGQ